MHLAVLLLLIAAVKASPSFNPIDDPDSWDEFVRGIPKSTMEDAELHFVELVTKYGYPIETHNVKTKDGYILTMYRIPYGMDGPSLNRPAVLLQHGILSSSDDWITPGPGKSLGYVLADRGYDVWFGNARGNQHSRNHSFYDPDNPKHSEFWDFSWHEIGTIDLPAMIDYVLETVLQDKLFYVGHSQGTTAFYVMCAERPEYNDKIRAHFSLAPIGFMKHMTSPLFQMIAKAEGVLEKILEWVGMNEFLPTDGFIHKITKGMCEKQIWTKVCANALFVACGFNEAQTNLTLLPVILGHTPGGSATKQFIHYAQEINSGHFRKFDYKLQNLRMYGSLLPPKYKLSKITAPIYLFYSRNDWLSKEVDVLKLYNNLGNVQGKFLVADEKFNHLDYLFGIDADTLVYNKVMSLMTRH